ncbi:MAG TPA: hypothetical protein VLJ16_06530, partial [Acidobacteriota bacterium]|nr:hypothetical protein [Acidobacteriota bacterium]
MRRSVLVLFLGLVLAVPLLVSVPPQPPSDEGFLILMLMRNRTGIERLQGEIETAEQEIEANRQIIETAEKKLQNAKETRNRQASIIPENDLSRARAVRRELAKAQSRRRRALATAEGNADTLKAMVAGGDAAGSDRPVLAMVTPLSGRANVLRKSGAKAGLQEGRAGLLSAGDGVSSTGSDHIEVQALDGRAIIQLHGGSGLEIVADAPEAQNMRLARGTISAAVETSGALDRAVEERRRAPDDDLTPFLQRYQARVDADRAGPSEKVLRI